MKSRNDKVNVCLRVSSASSTKSWPFLTWRQHEMSCLSLGSKGYLYWGSEYSDSRDIITNLNSSSPNGRQRRSFRSRLSFTDSMIAPNIPTPADRRNFSWFYRMVYVTWWPIVDSLVCHSSELGRFLLEYVGKYDHYYNHLRFLYVEAAFGCSFYRQLYSGLSRCVPHHLFGDSSVIPTLIAPWE